MNVFILLFVYAPTPFLDTPDWESAEDTRAELPILSAFSGLRR